jgi:glucose-6-phosphate isomerase
MKTMKPIGKAATRQPAWKELESHAKDIKTRHLKSLFESDPQRGQCMTAAAAGLFLDYSKNLLTDQTIALLIGLANECGLRERMEAMFRGDKINVTENRALLHTALRAPKDATVTVDGKNVVHPRSSCLE